MAEQQHDQEQEGTYGMALGFNLVEENGQFFLVEAEISPYVDQPEELGVTLVFHPLEGIDPSDSSEEVDWPAWPLDIDDDLSRDGSLSIPQQFQQIVRQLHGLSTEQLRGYLGQAREGGE